MNNVMMNIIYWPNIFTNTKSQSFDYLELVQLHGSCRCDLQSLQISNFLPEHHFPGKVKFLENSRFSLALCLVINHPSRFKKNLLPVCGVPTTSKEVKSASRNCFYYICRAFQMVSNQVLYYYISWSSRTTWKEQLEKLRETLQTTIDHHILEGWRGKVAMRRRICYNI